MCSVTTMASAENIQVCEETLEAHQARLGDLRGLVARIAADVGLDAGGPLDDDVAALGRRLEDVRESLAALAEVAEAQQIGQNELQSTCNFLASVKQSLSMVEEANEKDIENQLGALRNHLLALGKTEGQLQTLKERPIDLSPSKSETSVVEILQLWQQVFRETFQHYHRLSARLVKSQDSAAALRLWHEYLLHVQSFLSSSIPEDYRGLTEHQHLCEVHQNLLMSQQSVLLSQNEGRTHQDGVELSVIEQFNSLTNLHNETLARIMERHSEVGERLVSWEKYSQEQARLLAWLRDLERERSRLQLHNIHIRRIPKVLSHIQTMLEKEVPLGESQALELLELQNNLFHNTDDTVASSVRLAYATITQRISNLKAALETWKDHLDRINSLVSTYEKNATNVQTVFQEIHSAICESQALISHADVRNRLDSLRNLRSRILVLTSDLETMNVTLEQLRECLSPMDMKTLNQRTWLLWQSHNDLDHQLAVLCHHLEERINLFTLFDTRRSRFLVWVEDMVLRLDQICVGDPEEVLSRIQTDIQGDIALKSREVDWLLSTGHELIAAASGDDENSTTEQNDLQKKLSEVHRCWEELQNLAANKVNKLQNILQNLSHLEQQLSELRKWCHQIETQLMKPLVITECTQEVYAERLQEIEDLQSTIEQQSGKVGEVLNVSELLLSDYELVKTTVNTESISIATDAIEKRWKHICEVSTERKRNFMNTWKLLKNLLNGCREKQRWIEIQEDILESIQRKINQISPSELQDYLSQVEGVLEELQSQKQRLVVLDHSYSQFVKSCRMVPDNLSPTTSLIHVTLQRWHALIPMATALADLLCQELKMYRDFVNIHGKAVMNLTELDTRLTQLQHLHSPDSSSSSMSQEIIEQLERELRALNSLLQTADSLGMTLLQKCKEEDQSSIQVMIDEYQLLRRDITIRLATLKAEYLSEGGASLIKERDESIQVETLRFEQDSAIQVNTLPHLAEIAPQSRGFDTAIAECKSNLATLKAVLEESPTDGSKLATALAGSQSSIELVRHLSSRLGERGGVTEEQRRTQEVTALNTEYERLCSLACVQHQNTGESSENARLTCPLCSQFNWQQLDNDLWRLEQWLQFSEGTQSNYQVPPSDIEQLEDTIQDHREFLVDLDSHRNIVMSLNIVGTHLADHADDQEKAEALRARLEKTNIRWEAVCQAAAQWQTQLQHALMENQGFHRIIEELMEWLENTEDTIRLAEPVDLTEESNVVEAKYNKFRELHEELERCEPRVMSLQDAADQLLRQSDAPENSVLTRLTSLRLRLQSLRRITGIYVLKLGAVLGHDPSELGLVASHRTGSGQNVGASLVSLSQELLEQAAAASSIHTETRHSNDNGTAREDEVDTTVLTRGYQFFGRVLRASLPIQALMLLILGVASLVPSREEDYSCILSNNLANSFEPLLFYPNGPPPV
ncbi:Nesprin-1 [Gryllus bimaculatus]|nr:Nesprin-1 [Gryllus bimaculatus]